MLRAVGVIAARSTLLVVNVLALRALGKLVSAALAVAEGSEPPNGESCICGPSSRSPQSSINFCVAKRPRCTAPLLALDCVQRVSHLGSSGNAGDYHGLLGAEQGMRVAGVEVAIGNAGIAGEFWTFGNRCIWPFGTGK